MKMKKNAMTHYAEKKMEKGREWMEVYDADESPRAKYDVFFFFEIESRIKWE